MGSGACKGVCVAVQDASDEEILQFFAAWPSDQRERVNGLLSSCSEKAPAELSEALQKAESKAKPLDEKQLKQVHSAFRWGKPIPEIEQVVNEWGNELTMKDAICAADTQNGNLALHIAAQNGHMSLTRFLLEQGAEPNAQNFNGQTALHMSVEYDMYFQSKLLLDAKADPNITNAGGHKALTGLEGLKTGQDAWDNAMNILKAANDDEEEMKAGGARGPGNATSKRNARKHIPKIVVRDHTRGSLNRVPIGAHYVPMFSVFEFLTAVSHRIFVDSLPATSYHWP